MLPHINVGPCICNNSGNAYPEERSVLLGRRTRDNGTGGFVAGSQAARLGSSFNLPQKHIGNILMNVASGAAFVSSLEKTNNKMVCTHTHIDLERAKTLDKHLAEDKSK